MEQWDIDIISDLKDKRIFYLTDKDTYVGIEQCFNIWTDYPETVFDYRHRLAGTIESIKNFLLSFDDLDMTEDTVENYLSSIITLENYVDVQYYNTEKNERYDRQKNALMALTMENKDNLYDMMVKLNPSLILSKTPAKKPKVYRELPGSKKGLEYRLSLLGDDEYLNVSKINSNGVGARKIKNIKKGMFADSKTKLASDNYNGVLVALQLIPSGTQLYDKTLRSARNFFEGYHKPSIISPSRELVQKLKKSEDSYVKPKITLSRTTTSVVSSGIKKGNNLSEPESVKPLFKNFKERNLYANKN